MVFTVDSSQNAQCSNDFSKNILKVDCFHVGCQCLSHQKTQSIDDYIFGYGKKHIKNISGSASLEKEPLPPSLRMFEDSQLAEGINASLTDGRVYSQQREDELRQEELRQEELRQEELRQEELQEEETIYCDHLKHQKSKCSKETTELVDRIMSIYDNLYDINNISEPSNCNTIDYENNIRRHDGCPTCGMQKRYCRC